jgi:hypothetical protein
MVEKIQVPQPEDEKTPIHAARSCDFIQAAAESLGIRTRRPIFTTGGAVPCRRHFFSVLSLMPANWQNSLTLYIHASKQLCHHTTIISDYSGCVVAKLDEEGHISRGYWIFVMPFSV